MASNPGSDAAFSTQKSMLSGSPRTMKVSLTDQEVFYMNCRAAYLTIFKSSLENIISKDQLCLGKQSYKQIEDGSYCNENCRHRALSWFSVKDIYRQTDNWSCIPGTHKVEEENKLLKLACDFLMHCIQTQINNKEKPTSKAELLKSFKQLDANDDGSILHSDLHKYLTKRGEKMTQEEINAVISLADVNANGKFDYIKFCKLYMTTSEQCLKTTLERLEADSKLKRQQFGSHIERSPERESSPVPKPSPRIIRKNDQETFSSKGDTSHSFLSASKKFKTSVSFTITMSANSSRESTLTEPNLQTQLLLVFFQQKIIATEI